MQPKALGGVACHRNGQAVLLGGGDLRGSVSNCSFSVPGVSVRANIVCMCVQELLAAQLIQAFADIFSESSLPLYLRPYEVP